MARLYTLPADWTIKLAKKIERSRVERPSHHISLGNARRWLPKDWLAFFPPITPSSIRDYGRCQRYYFWRWRMGLRLKSEYSTPLEIGTAFHTIARRVLQDKVDAEEAALDLLYGHPGGDDSRERFDLAKAGATAIAYWKLCNPVPPNLEPILVEERVDCTAGRSIPTLSGQLDAVFRDKNTGWLWIMDHKTTGRDPHKLVPALPFDAQTTHYMILSRARFAKESVAGMIHNIMLKPGQSGPRCRTRGHEDETPEDYMRRLLTWYEDLVDVAKTVPSKSPLARAMLLFPEHPPDDYKWVLKQCGRAARRATYLHEFPRCANMYTCSDMFGRECPFIRLCRVNDPDKTFQMAAEHYEQESIYDRLYGDPNQ